MLKKWGEGASMLRGAWKARSPDAIEVDEDEGMKDDDDDDDEEDADQGDDENGDSAVTDVQTEEASAGETDMTIEVDSSSQSTIAPKQNRRTNRRRAPKNTDADASVAATNDHPTASNTTTTTTTRGNLKPRRHIDSKGSSASASESVDELTTSLNSLSLLPPSVRFGRGAAHGGFMRVRGYGRGGPRGGRRGMYYAGIGAPHESHIGEREGKSSENGAGAGRRERDGESVAMVPRVLVGKRGTGRMVEDGSGVRGGGRGERRKGSERYLGR